MRVTRHLDLPNLKAFSARLAAAIEFGRVEQFQDDEDKRAQLLHVTIAGRADELIYHTGNLDEGLQSFASFCLTGSTRQPITLRRKLKRLGERARKIECRACAAACERSVGKQHICNGRDRASDHKTVEFAGHCIEPLKQLESEVRGWVTDLVRRHAASLLPPEMKLATTHRHLDVDSDLVGHFSIGGWHEVADDQDGPASIIGLDIKEAAFDWSVLCTIPYVLTHELLCHGFQGLITRSGRSRRIGSPPECAWSEGWMDRLAYELARFWTVERHGVLPSWLDERTSIDDAAGSLHAARYRCSTLAKRTLINERRAARNDFDAFRAAWGSRAPVDEHPATEFSLCFNLQELNFDMRHSALMGIRSMLVQGGFKREKLLGVCRDFLESRQVAPLLDELCREAGVPLP